MDEYPKNSQFISASNPLGYNLSPLSSAVYCGKIQSLLRPIAHQQLFLYSVLLSLVLSPLNFFTTTSSQKSYLDLQFLNFPLHTKLRYKLPTSNLLGLFLSLSRSIPKRGEKKKEKKTGKCSVMYIAMGQIQR